MEEIKIIDPRDRLRYPLYQTRVHRLATKMLGALFRLVMKLQVEGLENIPAQGGIILAANHLTNYDIFPLQLSLHRPIFYMGKAELFRNPIAHLLFRNLGAFPVYRGERDEWAIKHARRILEHGLVLGMFPEGTRSHGGGLKVAKTGVARLSIATHLPIIPVAINGSQRLFQTFPKRTCISIRYCDPIWPSIDEMPLNLTDRIMYELAQHLPPELRGVYAQIPGDIRSDNKK